MKPDQPFDTVPIAGVTVAPAPSDPAMMAVAGAVHDLGNLIQLAISAVGIIGRSPAVRNGDLAPVAASANASLERAGMLVRQALDGARERAAAIRTARMADCLAEVEASMPGAPQSGIHLDVMIDENLPEIACDPLGLQCAVLNLLFNARDAMAGHGVIRLRAGRDARAGASRLELQVIDGGIGMSPETIERAMDPFFTTKADGLGGIGLPMVERFARACGGELCIESKPDVGTTVTMRLPFVGPAEPVPAPRGATPDLPNSAAAQKRESYR
jgi:signal transduction histidine kinase